ncbi:MAG TPA: LysR family transcriptional regulator [Thermoanaerobaculia bacterium]|nr:LysR family transcriptional regulator [Thermoanaerobaculia bacterium]
MDVRQLEMFRAVVEAGSFTGAAQRLHISQSAISRQLQLLEKELGTLLLRRTGRGVTVTPEGHLLLSAANRIWRDLQEVVAQISDTQNMQSGSISLGGGMTVCLHILPRLLKKFRTMYRNVDLRITTGTAPDLLQQLREHDVDLLLLTLPIYGPDLEVVPVLKEEMIVVSAKNHPLSRARVVEAKTLARYPLILFESGSNTRKVVDEFFQDAQMPVNVVMETENVEIIKAMVANGLGVTVLPYGALAADLRAGRFAWARIRGHRLYRHTGWVYLKGAHRPKAIQEVLRVFDEMKEQFGGKPPGH